jgi:hypothetical protein
MERDLTREEGAEAFLLEMAVVGENVGQAFPPHRLHRNAVRQAVTLVGTLNVKIETGQEGSAALRNHPDRGTGQNVSDAYTGFTPHRLVLGGEKGQIFRQYLVGRDDGVRSVRGGQGQCLFMAVVAEIGEGNPIKRIGKERRHASFFLGQP